MPVFRHSILRLSLFAALAGIATLEAEAQVIVATDETGPPAYSTSQANITGTAESNPVYGSTFSQPSHSPLEALEERGIGIDIYATQFYQGVASGGVSQNWFYGGKIDYLLDVDGGKAGLWEGVFVDMHSETRFGKSVNSSDGLLAPSNVSMSFPEPEGSITSITGLKVTQALSESFAVYGGKINTLDEYPLQYNGGPGLGGFMNTSLVFNPIAARTVPYAAAGVGAAFLRDGAPVLTITAFDPEERATTGLENLYERGVVIVPELSLRRTTGGLPGIFNFGGTYSSASYASLDPAAYLASPVLPGALPRRTGSWCLYSNSYQALWADETDSTRNWGVFGQFGIADGNPNPASYTVSAGLGGSNLIVGRPLDTFGVGYFHIGLSDDFKTLTAPLLPQHDNSGFEIFYNYAVTPWCRLTYDLQVVEPSTISLDTTITTGLRMQIIL